MKHPVLFVIVPMAFALNAWVGHRAQAGQACPVLMSPADELRAIGDDGSCARQCRRAAVRLDSQSD